MRLATAAISRGAPDAAGQISPAWPSAAPTANQNGGPRLGRGGAAQGGRQSRAALALHAFFRKREIWPGVAVPVRRGIARSLAPRTLGPGRSLGRATRPGHDVAPVPDLRRGLLFLSALPRSAAAARLGGADRAASALLHRPDQHHAPGRAGPGAGRMVADDVLLHFQGA